VYRARVTLKERAVKDGIGHVLPATPLPANAASSVASAREAYLRGDFPQAVAALEGRTFDDPRLRAEALFILSRALLRLQRSAEVVELLREVLATLSNVDEVCTARMLHATAVARCQDVDRGLDLLATTAKFAQSRRADRAIQAEIAYYRGLAHWTKHEYLQTSTYAKQAERSATDVLSVRATQLRAFAALASAQFGKALELFERARKSYALCRGRDLDLATQILFQIAFLEMNLRSAKILGSHAHPGGRTIPGTSFGPAVATSTRMMLTSADAWLYAHDGDQVTAARKAHDAISFAPTPAWQVWSRASGTLVLQAFGETGTARYIADQAATIAESVDWDTTTNEERIGLLMLAEACASVNPALAAAMLRRYDDVTSPMDPTRVLRDRDADPRLAGWDAHVRGLVARIAGEHERAGAYFRTSAELFSSCGYLWREALALIELDATPIDTQGDFALERAARIVRDNFPSSFLTRRLGSWGRAYVDPVAGKLTRTQRDILHRVLEGKSPTTIAEETHRASGTVRKHIECIHGIFGTHSVGELFAACVRRGIWSIAADPVPERPELRRTS
jgi:DNA-binding CsgD family transcriptional regulator/tetratricopeptide (TPR) repeat protein